MIKFSKISEGFSFILVDGERVGTLQKIGDRYILEMYYESLTLEEPQKKLITGIIEGVYKRRLARKYRELKGSFKLRHSIIRSNYLEKK